MSLDVYLTADVPVPRKQGSGIFVRREGQTVEITREEWDRLYPDREPVRVVSDDEVSDSHEVYSANITHNLNKMADAAGIYEALWRPSEVGIERAEQLIAPLTDGLAKLQSNPDHYAQYNPENGWGSYDGLVQFVANYLRACKANPQAKVSVWA